MKKDEIQRFQDNLSGAVKAQNAQLMKLTNAEDLKTEISIRLKVCVQEI